MPDAHFNITGCNPCCCGFIPTILTVMYGKTPYDIKCDRCNKHTYRYRSIGGSPTNAVVFWNEIAPLHEITKDWSLLVYEVLDEAMLFAEVRPAILKAWISEKHNIKVYILFSNGKVEISMHNFLYKYDYE